MVAQERRQSNSTSKSSTKKQKDGLSPWQADFIGVEEDSEGNVITNPDFDADLRIACTGISAGKSRALAWWLIMQMVRLNGCRCIAIAQTHKALKRVLIRELQIVCNLLHLSYDYNKSEQEFALANNSTLFGYSGENPEAMLGLSEIDILAIDEAAYCPEECYQYASDRMRGGKYEPMSRMISSPQSMAAENWFSELCKKHPECVVHATAFDNKFTSDKFKQSLKDRYIEGSNVYRQQVLGEIFDFDIASQIVMRKDFIAAKLISTDKRYWLGADFAGLGTDSNMVAVIDDTGVVDWFGAPDLNTQQKTEQISGAWEHWNPVSACGDQTGGYGQGAIDLLEAKQMHMTGVNFSQKPFNEKLYPNARTEMFIELAQAIKQGFWVPEEAKTELLAIQYCIDNRGRQSLLPKELVKKQLGGRSPDLADAIALALYAKNHGEASTVSGYSAKQASDVANRLMRLMR
jgi:hypothetical protein